MIDESFLNSIILERMEMHYSSCKGATASELTNSLKLEEEYNRVLETLPDAARESIEGFVKCLNSKSADGEAFFYRKGVKDGLLLYELLTRL